MSSAWWGRVTWYKVVSDPVSWGCSRPQAWPPFCVALHRGKEWPLVASPLRLAATAHGLPAVQSDHFTERGFGGFLRNTLLGLRMFPSSALIVRIPSIGILVRTVKEEETESLNLSRDLFRPYWGLAWKQCSNLGDVRGLYIGKKVNKVTFNTLGFTIRVHMPPWLTVLHQMEGMHRKDKVELLLKLLAWGNWEQGMETIKLLWNSWGESLIRI